MKTFIDFPIYNENNEIWYLENIADEEFLKKLTEKITPFPESEFDNNQFFQTPIENYLEGLSRFDLSSTDYIVKQFEGLISDVNEQFKPDAIFIDSRTGFTDVFGITALQLSSQVVGFFNNSVQTEPGLFQFINSIQEVLKSKDNYSIPIIINAFSDDMMFDEFRQKSDNFIFQKDVIIKKGNNEIRLLPIKGKISVDLPFLSNNVVYFSIDIDDQKDRNDRKLQHKRCQKSARHCVNPHRYDITDQPEF